MGNSVVPAAPRQSARQCGASSRPYGMPIARALAMPKQLSSMRMQTVIPTTTRHAQRRLLYTVLAFGIGFAGMLAFLRVHDGPGRRSADTDR